MRIRRRPGHKTIDLFGNNECMNRPEIHDIEGIEVAQPRVREVSSGAKMYLLRSCDDEVVRFSLVFRAGSAVQRVPFSASGTANLLSEGSRHHSAQQIAEMLDFLGSNYEVALDRDWASLNFVTLKKHFNETLEIAREIVLEPAFDSAEVAIYREKNKQRLAIDRSRASMRARELFAAALFGEHHPYGEFYPEALYDNLTSEVVAEFYKQHYTAANCFLVASGCVDESEIAGLERFVSDLPTGVKVDENVLAGKLKTVPHSSLHTPHSTASAGADDKLSAVPCLPTVTMYAEQPNAVQSAIRMGVLLFPRTHPDFVGMQVLATVLGGYFGSRLVRNLREERGYTYGVFSTMVTLQSAGYLAIATEVGAEVTDDAIAQIKSEMEVLRHEPVPDDELAMVKNIMMGEVMRVLDGPFGISDVTIENVCNGQDNTYNTRWLAEVRATDAPRLLALAKKYLDPAAMTTVVVGPK